MFCKKILLLCNNIMKGCINCQVVELTAFAHTCLFHCWLPSVLPGVLATA